LNWMVVDEEFKKVNSTMHMGSVQVPFINGGDYYKSLTGPASMTVRRNGWLYVYVSNESAQDVYFDDIVINHARGPVVEANNYYAFGLEIPGLNSKAIGFGGNADNRIKYNGKEAQQKEFADGSGLEWMDYGARMYASEIGRWMRPDPLADISRRWSPYNYAYDNPIRFIDLDGMMVGEAAPRFTDWVKHRDDNGRLHVDWDANVTNRQQAQKKYGKDAEYVGKTGIVLSGYTKDSEASTVYRLNDDGTATRADGTVVGKPSTTKGDNSNGEPKGTGIDVSKALNDINGYAGGVGLEAGLAEGAMTKGVNALEDLGELAAPALKGVKIAGGVAAAVGIATATVDMIKNPTAGSATRVGVQMVAAGAAFVPGIGWALSAGIGLADMIWGDDFYNWIDKK